MDHQESGKQWQQHVLRALKQLYLPDTSRVTDFPDRTNGDGGIDILVKDKGQIFQCYLPDDPVSARALNDAVATKLTDDLKKLQTLDTKVVELGPSIREWCLVTPVIYDKKLITLCTDKAKEVRGLGLPFIDAQAFQVTICTQMDVDLWGKGAAPQPDQMYRTTPWSALVWDHPLWRGRASPLRRAAARIADLCFAHGDVAVGNPWRDPYWPNRVMACLGRLLDDDPFSLNDREVALLLTAPFLRAAAQSGAESAAWERIQGQADDWPGLWARHQDRKPQSQRKMDRLLSSPRPQDPEDGVLVRHWLLHDLIRRRPESWKRHGQGGLLSDGVFEHLDKIRGTQAQADPFADLANPFIFARAADLAPQEILNAPDRYPADQEIQWQMARIGMLRPRLLAALSSLAAQMGLDPLLMPDVLVDHVGLHDSLRPSVVHDHFSRAKWGDPDLTLDMECTHPAIDMAACETVQHLTALRAHLLDAWRGNRNGLDGVEKLAVFRDTLVRSKLADQGGVCYLPRPHVHFTLSNDDVRELLMGEKLYGDPSLALRELYQNALDACRYRQAREAFEGRADWQGSITFIQDRDGDGRPYIECRDTGIGMGEAELRHCFAKAGKRFVDSDDYLEEAAQWAAKGIAHFPNSQFGVGVFSYFMLAEEIIVTTCRMPRQGQGGGKPLRVSISGSGSLFRLLPCPDWTGGYGTCVRLYLSRTEGLDGKPISAVNTLTECLWVAEFPTHVREWGQPVKHWQPDHLEMEDTPLALIHQDRDCQIWWAEGRACLLADGVFVGDRLGPGLGAVIVNLRKALRPALSVNRKEVLSWEKDLIRQKIAEHGGAALPNFPCDDYEWFLGEITSYPLLIQEYVPHINAPMVWGGLEINVAEFGFFTGDEEITGLHFWDQAENLKENYPPALWRHRIAALGALDVLPVFRGSDEAFAILASVPSIAFLFEPLDGVLLSQNLNGRTPWLPSGPVPLGYVQKLRLELKLPLAEVKARMQRLSVFGLEFHWPDEASLPAPDPADIALLSFGTTWRSPWTQKITCLQALRATSMLNQPLSHILERLRAYQLAGLDIALDFSADVALLPPVPDFLSMVTREGRVDMLDADTLEYFSRWTGAPIPDIVRALAPFQVLGPIFADDVDVAGVTA